MYRAELISHAFVIAMLAVVLLVAYIPQVSLFVPQLIFGK